MSRLAAVLSAVALLTTSGCASIQSRKARAERLEAELDALRYAQPLAQVWQEARVLLVDRGFPLASEDAKAVGRGEISGPERFMSPARATRPMGESSGGILQQLGLERDEPETGSGLVLATGWNSAPPRERRQLEAYTVGDAVRVVVWRIVEDPSDQRQTTDRDLEAELELLRRLDPQAAKRIEEAVRGVG